VIFDYATDYCIKHPTIASAEDFKLTDADYADFKKKVKAADFKYDQQSEKLLKALKEAAEFEGYLGDASDEFAKLEKKLQHNLDKDLDHFAKDIKSTIALEIVKRYYYQRGTVIEQLKEDRDLERAIAVLKSPSEYKKILSAQK
jgi:carboxyl-terminal processing protease